MRAAVATLALAALSLACSRPAEKSGERPPVEPPRFDADAAVPDEAPSAPPEDPKKEALVRFESARRSMIAEQDIEAGVRHLEEAVRLDPGFGEAWFQLSTAWIEQATAAVLVDEKDAAQRLRKGLETGRKALELMRAGSLRTWNAFELREAEQQLADLLAQFPDVSTDAKAAGALRAHREKEGYVDDPEAGEAAAEEPAVDGSAAPPAAAPPPPAP